MGFSTFMPSFASKQFLVQLWALLILFEAAAPCFWLILHALHRSVRRQGEG